MASEFPTSALSNGLASHLTKRLSHRPLGDASPVKLLLRPAVAYLVLVRRMKVLAGVIAVACFAQICAGGEPPPPRTPYHLLLGPYEYECTREEEAQWSAFD